MQTDYNADYFNQWVQKDLPAAHFCGVAVDAISADECSVSLTYQHANQNPFGSIYFAALGMAAELSTGAMVIREVSQAPEAVSMLVLNQTAGFTKKARGTVVFRCTQGALIADALAQTLRTREGVTLHLQSVGYDEAGDAVANMDFEWTLKVKQP